MRRRSILDRSVTRFLVTPVTLTTLALIVRCSTSGDENVVAIPTAPYAKELPSSRERTLPEAESGPRGAPSVRMPRFDSVDFHETIAREMLRPWESDLGPVRAVKYQVFVAPGPASPGADATERQIELEIGHTVDITLSAIPSDGHIWEVVGSAGGVRQRVLEARRRPRFPGAGS